MFGKRKTFQAPVDPMAGARESVLRSVDLIAKRMDDLTAANEALEKDKQAMVHTIGAIVLQCGGSFTIDPVHLAVVDEVQSEHNIDGSITLRAR